MQPSYKAPLLKESMILSASWHAGNSGFRFQSLKLWSFLDPGFYFGPLEREREGPLAKSRAGSSFGIKFRNVQVWDFGLGPSLIITGVGTPADRRRLQI